MRIDWQIRVIVRPSNTEPIVRLQAATSEELENVDQFYPSVKTSKLVHLYMQNPASNEVDFLLNCNRLERSVYDNHCWSNFSGKSANHSSLSAMMFAKPIWRASSVVFA